MKKLLTIVALLGCLAGCSKNTKPEVSAPPIDSAVQAALNEEFTNRISAEYDKFKEYTDIEPREYIEVTNSLKVIPITHVKSSESSPHWYAIHFLSQSEDWKFLKDSRLILLFDGKKKDFGDLKHNGDVVDGGVLEQMNAVVTPEEFHDIAYAQNLEGQLGGVEFSIGYDARRDWRTMIVHFAQ